MARKPRAAAPLIEEEEILTAVVIPPQDDDVPEAVVTTLKSTALQVISVTDAHLEAIEATYAKFTIDGDQTRYKEAKQVKNKLVKVRTGIERKRKEVNKEFVDAVNAEAARITARTSAVEQHLATQVTEFEEAEERRRQERISLVTERLKASGFTFNGVAYECGERTIWQIEIENITDEALIDNCMYAEEYRNNEMLAEQERKRQAEIVYLHHPDVNELITLTRGEYEPEAQAYIDSGVVEITKERYEEIKAAKLAAFKRPAPKPTPAPVASTMPAVSSRTPKFGGDDVFMNEGFVQPQPLKYHHPSPTEATIKPSAQIAQAMAESGAKKDDYERGWDEGYEGFRIQVLRAFGDANIKRARAEWIDWFTNLTPYGN